MFGLFGARLPIEADEFEWMLACFRWFMEEFDGARSLYDRALVLPDTTTFPKSRAQGHERAVELFETVKARAGMSDWDCDLVVGEGERERRVTTGHGLKHVSQGPPLGTFGYADGRYRITYNPSELKRPQSLVATFAHELAHYLLHTARTPSPGGRDLHEHATDLAAVYLGFGIFMANSSKTFSQFQDFGEQGWEMRPQGYLSELALTTGLAVFVRLSASDAKAAESELKNYLRAPFRKALKAIDRKHPDLRASISAIDLAEWIPSNDS